MAATDKDKAVKAIQALQERTSEMIKVTAVNSHEVTNVLAR